MKGEQTINRNPHTNKNSMQSAVSYITEDNLYRNVVQDTIEGFILANSRLEILDVNDSFCRMIGYSREELLSMSLQDIDVEFIKALGEASGITDIRTKDNDTFEVQFRCKEGHIIDVLASFKRMKDNPEYFFYFFKDITEQKKSTHLPKESEDKYQTLFENIPVGIIEMDCSRVKMYIDRLRSQGITNLSKYFNNNPRALEYCYKSLIVNSVNKYIADIHKPVKRKYLTNIEMCAEHFLGNRGSSNLKQVLKLILLFEKGNDYRLHNATFVDYRGRVNYLAQINILEGYENTWAKVIMIVHDITKIKQTEMQLQEYKEHLEELVEKRTSELAQANKILEEQIQKRISFTRALVHELKTPLTSLQVTNDLLLEEVSEHPHFHELAYNIARSVRSLGKRTDDLLDIARGEIGLLKLKERKVNLDKFFTDLDNDLSLLAKDKGKKLEFNMQSSLPVAIVDDERISQVIHNLVDNAFKFTTVGGEVMVSASIESNSLIVSVSDTGRGISKDRQKLIFRQTVEGTSRIDNDSQRFNGLGIGLVLSKMIVDLHGGLIWIDSEPGKGSIFTFSIPLRYK